MWFNHYQKVVPTHKVQNYSLYAQRHSSYIMLCKKVSPYPSPTWGPAASTTRNCNFSWSCEGVCLLQSGNPSEITPMQGRGWKLFLINDIISRAAIKQINCHAHRAKISNYPLSPSSLCRKLETARKPVGGSDLPTGSVLLASFAVLDIPLHEKWAQTALVLSVQI